MNTFLSWTKNGGISTDSVVFVMLNLGGLLDVDYISDNWLDVSGKSLVEYTLKVS